MYCGNDGEKVSRLHCTNVKVEGKHESPFQVSICCLLMIDIDLDFTEMMWQRKQTAALLM